MAVCPLYAQSVKNSNKAEGIKSEQGNSESLLHDSGIRTIKLFLCGDVMTGRGIDQILPHPGNPTLYEGYMKSAAGYVELAEEANGPILKPVSFSYIWGDALAELRLRKPDLRIINLETAITRSNDVQEKAVNYRMNPDNIPCITAADIECCALANNHVLDWGYQGLAETLDTLRKAGIKTTGAGANIRRSSSPCGHACFRKGARACLLIWIGNKRHTLELGCHSRQARRKPVARLLFENRTRYPGSNRGAKTHGRHCCCLDSLGRQLGISGAARATGICSLADR